MYQLNPGHLKPIALTISYEQAGKPSRKSRLDNNEMESKMKTKVMKFLQDEEGLTVVEYAVAAGLISAVVVAAFRALGLTVNGIITNLNAALTGGP